MDQQHRSETYRGHEISATAYEVRPGWWAWSYTVGDIAGQSAKAALLRTAEAALQRAPAAARVRVDERG